MGHEREAFEQAIFAYYSDLKAKGWSAPGEGDFTREALCWRNETGNYGVASVAAAWGGWQMRARWVPPPVVYHYDDQSVEHTACPWCGERGPDFDESPMPSDYCDHT